MEDYFKYPGSSFEDRINWVKALVFFLVFLIVVRAIFLQLIEHSKLDEMAQENARRIKVTSVRRGMISDAEGELLAVSLPVYSVFAYPEKMTSKTVAKKAFDTVLVNYDDNFINKTGFTWIKRYITDNQYKALNKLDLEGVHFEKEFKRVFPRHFTASQLLGLVGYDSEGLDGLEYRYNDYLMAQNDAGQNEYSSLTYYPQGHNVKLTISQKIQYFTERSLRNSVVRSQSKSGIVIVMESKTGAILAMAGYPTFDPNIYRNYSKELYINKAINTAYEPGSTFKVITLAIARQMDYVQPETSLFCENGAYKVMGETINDVKSHGVLSLKEIIKYSSNICMSKIGKLIPRQTFYDWILKFGFGKKTGIDLPGESPGVVHNFKAWSELDQAVMSYGHSIQVTPVQLISAINVIANDGVYYSPYVVQNITNAEGREVFLPKRTSYQVISPEVANEITEYMMAVVEKNGTGSRAAIPGLKVAGKTGTTKKIDPDNGKYSSENHIHSFVGFLPADDPSITVLAILNEPREKYLDSLTAAPMFKEIALNAYRFYTKKQSKKFESTEKKYDSHDIFGARETIARMDELVGKSLREALIYGSQQEKQIRVQGQGKIKEVGYLSTDRISVILDK